jgi:ACT domain-containing protein
LKHEYVCPKGCPALGRRESTEVIVLKDRAVITVLGADKVGIVAAITAALARRRVNIEDIRMAVMEQQLFTMIALVDMSQMDGSFAMLKEELDAIGAELGVQVLLQREEVFKFMHRV